MFTSNYLHLLLSPVSRFVAWWSFSRRCLFSCEDLPVTLTHQYEGRRVKEIEIPSFEVFKIRFKFGNAAFSSFARSESSKLTHARSPSEIRVFWSPFTRAYYSCMYVCMCNGANVVFPSLESLVKGCVYDDWSGRSSNGVPGSCSKKVGDGIRYKSIEARPACNNSPREYFYSSESISVQPGTLKQ